MSNSERVKLACKVRDEYGMVQHLPQPKEVKPPAIKHNNSNHIPQDNRPGNVAPSHLLHHIKVLYSVVCCVVRVQELSYTYG